MRNCIVGMLLTCPIGKLISWHGCAVLECKPVYWADFQFEILRFESFGIKISHFFIIQNHQTSPMINTGVDLSFVQK